MKLTIALAALLIAPLAFAKLEPAAIFSDHAVLQQNKPITIWGKAESGERVQVEFDGKKKSSKADKDGFWSVSFPKQSANAVGQTLSIEGESESVSYEDILIGEVWLASGQSNMQWTLSSSFGSLDIASSAAYPNIRHFAVTRETSNSPLFELPTENAWEVPSPETAAAFSAVAYYFARELNTNLEIPIGIVNSSWGGSAVETWMTPRALSSDPASDLVKERWQEILESYPSAFAAYEENFAAWEKEKSEAEGRGEAFNKRRPWPPANKDHRDYPSNCYNAMIHPLANLSFQGVIWYQGESNASRHQQYRTLFSSLIEDWRQVFDDPELDFYWVQLASFNTGQGPEGRMWPYLREAQSQALNLPHTGQAITLDIGNATDIHPRDKLSVGRRLARIALAQTYGKDIAYLGPRMAEVVREENGYRIHFSNTDKGLFTPNNVLRGFELAGEDRDFREAEAVIEGDTVFVSSDSIQQPIAIRYAWKNHPVDGLFNREGLPAEPFRTDNW